MARQRQFEDPPFGEPPAGSGAVPYEPKESAPSSRVGKILQRETSRLMAIPGVRSVGETSGATGGSAIEIGVTAAAVVRSLPKNIDGVEVVTRVVGDVEAYRAT